MTAGAVAAAAAVGAANHRIITPCCSESNDHRPEPAATCPVAFMWRWTGAINLPFNHPPVAEVRANFDEQHYPKGLNAKFLEGDKHTCGDTFGQGNGKGIFEDSECREIAKVLPNIISMLQKYGLKYGSYVADVGAGTGLVTKELSREVGDCGEVYAQEISPGFQELLKEVIVTNKLSNVFVVGGSDKSAKLPDDAFDMILVCDVYHHFEYPTTMCK
jgi:SAM-dependent methyltransferase